MSKNILKALPEIYSFKRADYGRFVVREGASGLMRDNWIAVGDHMRVAATKVGEGVNKTNGSANKRETAGGQFFPRRRDESRTFGR
jgi:hypothetical protein